MALALTSQNCWALRYLLLQSHAVTTSVHRRRVDINGRAYAGSQRQIQTYVNYHAEVLDSAIRAVISEPNAIIEWRSPLSKDNFVEYRDEDALEVLGLSHRLPLLQKFWPRKGPCWDALANIQMQGTSGILLVEAKSHVAEIRSTCTARSDASLAQITEAFRITKEWLNVREDTDWLSDLYQCANRLAFLHLFRGCLQIPTWLINIYFLEDPRSPTSRREWETAIRQVKEELGISKPIPFCVDLLLPALQDYSKRYHR